MSSPLIEFLQTFIPGVMLFAGTLIAIALFGNDADEKKSRKHAVARTHDQITYLDKAITKLRADVVELQEQKQEKNNVIGRACPECGVNKSFPEDDYLCGDCRVDANETPFAMPEGTP